jgi:cytochrome b subunit of formate dehydrogenase
MGGAARWLLVVAAVALAAVGTAAILGQASSGAQPWDPELSDNFIFFKTLPFVMGLGVALGVLRARGTTAPQRRDGRVRRFSAGTIAGHWIATLGFVLALPTGIWQYLGGIIDVHLPVPLYLIYRVHYIGAALIVFAVANFAAYWWVNGDRSLWVPRGQWRRHLTGFAQELPSRLGRPLASRLGLDLTERPRPGRFTFYETAFSFPTWTFALALITITGIVKAMRYVYPIPGPVLFMASTLHVAAMGLLILKVLDHLRYTLPRWPLMVAMVKGWVSESALRRVLEPTTPATPSRTPEAVGAGTPAGILPGSDR